MGIDIEIVLKSDEESLELSIFKQGDLVGSTEVSRSVSLVEDVIEGLSRFDTVPQLPTRFIVYDGREGILDEIKQTLIQVDWNIGKINFLHTPQIEVLAVDKKVLATVLAGGAEMGNATGVSDTQEESSMEDSPDKNIEKTEEKPLPPEAVGFSVGEDVSSVQKEDSQNLAAPNTPTVSSAVSIKTEPIKSQVGLGFAKTATNYLSKSKNLFQPLHLRIRERIRPDFISPTVFIAQIKPGCFCNAVTCGSVGFGLSPRLEGAGENGTKISAVPLVIPARMLRLIAEQPRVP